MDRLILYKLGYLIPVFPQNTPLGITSWAYDPVFVSGLRPQNFIVTTLKKIVPLHVNYVSENNLNQEIFRLLSIKSENKVDREGKRIIRHRKARYMMAFELPDTSVMK